MNKSILFVDDEPEFISQHKHALRRAGYKVIEALTYEDAQYLLQENPSYDLIILDLILSNKDARPNGGDPEPDVEVGLNLLKYIREDLKLTKIPILFFSVVNDAQVFQKITLIEQKTSRAKLNYLAKPQLPSRLLALVNKTIG